MTCLKQNSLSLVYFLVDSQVDYIDISPLFSTFSAIEIF